jgi:hypothetical protein
VPRVLEIKYFNTFLTKQLSDLITNRPDPDWSGAVPGAASASTTQLFTLHVIFRGNGFSAFDKDLQVGGCHGLVIPTGEGLLTANVLRIEAHTVSLA